MVRFQGFVTVGDMYRQESSSKKGYIWIGHSDLLSIIHHSQFVGNVYAKLDNHIFHGQLITNLGFKNKSYSNDTDFFYIGEINILSSFQHYIGKNVVFTIAPFSKAQKL